MRATVHTRSREGHLPLLPSVITANSGSDSPVWLPFLSTAAPHPTPRRVLPASHTGAIFPEVTNNGTAVALTQKPGAGDSLQLGQELALSLVSSFRQPKPLPLPPSAHFGIPSSHSPASVSKANLIPQPPWPPRRAMPSAACSFYPNGQRRLRSTPASMCGSRSESSVGRCPSSLSRLGPTGYLESSSYKTSLSLFPYVCRGCSRS